MNSYQLKLTSWSPNEDYVPDPAMQNVKDNLYSLFFPFDTIGDQLESEIMPLRVQWAAEEGKSELDPRSESWKRFKQLYAMQFGEQKTVALYAPELSYAGEEEDYGEQYNFGRYIRIVKLYVKPQFRSDFEGFVQRFIVPAASEILRKKMEAKHLLPNDLRAHYKLPLYVRQVSINVNMPTLPEFELFIQEHLLRAARDTKTPVGTYRTITGDKHNYHLLFPYNSHQEMHHSSDRLMTASLMRAHQLHLLAKREGRDPQLQAVAYKPTNSAEMEAFNIADSLAGEFHGHAIDIEEIVHRIRPDMSSLLPERFTEDSVKRAWASLKA